MGTREFIIGHCLKYPGLGIQDVCKALFQSAYGCEHLIADESAAAEYIRREAACCKPHKGELIEKLDGSFYRVHLDAIGKGLDADVLAKAFALSARHIEGAKESLEEKLDVFVKLALEGEVPFDADEVKKALAAWKQLGYPAIHHTEEFRSLYAPAYRLVAEEYIQIIRPESM